MSKSLWILTKAVIISVIAIIGEIYIDYFYNALQNSEWLDVDGYTRIVIPDTFLYLKAIRDDGFLSVLFSDVKNAIGPCLLWLISGYDWRIVLLLNVSFLALLVHYMQCIFEFHNIQGNKAKIAILSFLSMPMVLYYSVGSLKEIPMMLILTASYFYYIKNRLGILLILSAVMVAFRYQIIVIIIIMLLTHKFKQDRIWALLIMLLLASAFYPLLYSLSILSADAVEIFREESGEAGSIGAAVEYIRRDVYFFSLFAVIFRVFQSLLEPIIVFMKRLSFFEDGSFSVIYFVELMSIIIMLPYLFIFFRKIFLTLYLRARLSDQAIFLYGFSITYVFLVGGFSFIQHRYLIPVFPILIMASVIDPEAKNTPNR